MPGSSDAGPRRLCVGGLRNGGKGPGKVFEAGWERRGVVSAETSEVDRIPTPLKQRKKARASVINRGALESSNPRLNNASLEQVKHSPVAETSQQQQMVQDGGRRQSKVCSGFDALRSTSEGTIWEVG